MAVCPKCGYSRFLLRPLTCENCRKVGCERCLGVFASTYLFPNRPPVQHRVCSIDCFEKFVTYSVTHGTPVTQSGQYWYLGNYHLTSEVASRAVRIQAQHLILAERHEDAARTYERIGMWKEAGETRRMAQRQQVVTQVHINVNDLFDQLRKMGLSASYTCPVCRSPSTITGDTRPDALSKCQYCGSIIRQTDLIDAISKVIGYH